MPVLAHDASLEEHRPRWDAAYGCDADAVAATLGVDGHVVAGRRVAVVDSRDGILALALITRLGAARVDAFDDGGCNTVTLTTLARRFDDVEALPETLHFLATRPYELPGDERAYDLLLWWDGVAMRRDPVRMLREMARLLAPQAHLLVRVPPDGAATADQLARAVLAAGLEPIRLDVDAVHVRPEREQLVEPLSALATRGARLLAYRPPAAE